MSTQDDLFKVLLKLKNIPSVPLPEYSPEDFGLGVLFWRTPNAIIVISDTGRVVLWNPAAERLFGWDYEEIFGQNVDILIPTELKLEHHVGLAKFRETGHGRLIDSQMPVRLPSKTKSGTNIVIEMLLSVLNAFGDVFVMAIVRDVSHLVRYEEAILGHAEHHPDAALEKVAEDVEEEKKEIIEE